VSLPFLRVPLQVGGASGGAQHQDPHRLRDQRRRTDLRAPFQRLVHRGDHPPPELQRQSLHQRHRPAARVLHGSHARYRRHAFALAPLHPLRFCCRERQASVSPSGQDQELQLHRQKLRGHRVGRHRDGSLQHRAPAGANPCGPPGGVRRNLQELDVRHSPSDVRRRQDEERFLRRRQRGASTRRGLPERGHSTRAAGGGLVRAQGLRQGRHPGGVHEGGLLHGLDSRQHEAVE
jgi:hypothetical protein